MTGPRSIAIVGVAGRFPDAPSVDLLWANVMENRSAARPVPEAAWRVPRSDVVDAYGEVRPDAATSASACLLGEGSFELSGTLLPEELVSRMSRHARLTASVGASAWKSVRSTNDRSRASVILANIALPTDGASRITEDLFFGAADAAIPDAVGPAVEPLDAIPSAMPAGLLARALGFGGGSFTLDAACASSLYAIHLACSDLEAGTVDTVLTGGVSLPQSLYTQVGFSQLQALSRSGRCLPYDESADGLVVGEGAAMVVLKRLPDALRDGDSVLAVIRGIGLSNDVGGSLLSPESEGQLRAMRLAYEQAGWRPDDVDLVEGHGTGTPRGDAVELASLAELWRGLPSRGSVLGSVKGNIGHLLTAAGAAGLCKVLSAMRAARLPPSMHRSNPTQALRDGPFRVLPSAEPWAPRGPGVPRRAAISGFGFGGINAHLLLEEVQQQQEQSYGVEVTRSSRVSCPVAIVGMSAHVGRLESLESFQHAVFTGESIEDALPKERWHALLSQHGGRLAELRQLRGAFIEAISLPAGRFKLPPNDVPKVLPQQLLTLKVAGEALRDATPLGPGPHLRFGTVVGLGLDLESTSFHLRWLARERVRRWAEGLGIDVPPDELDAWADEVREAVAPPLDASRTLGALGGIVPSRLSREFQLGGPSFAVADDQASGLRALVVAVGLLQRREADGMLACAVDLAGDARAMLTSDLFYPLSRSGSARPFDQRADGTKVAEGAVAVVLKRLDDAVAAGDRIYAVVRGVGVAGSGALESTDTRAREEAYVRAAKAAYSQAAVPSSRLGLVLAHGSAVPAEDATEARALEALFGDSGPDERRHRTALGSVAASVGQAGAAASLLSVVAAALSLHHEVLPPIGHVTEPTRGIDWARTPFHLPRRPEAWLRDRADGERVAAVSSMGLDGTCIHAVLEGSARVGEASRASAHTSALRGAAVFLLRGVDDGVGDAKRLSELACDASDLESLATRWHRESHAQRSWPVARGIVASSVAELRDQLTRSSAPSERIAGSLAMVFPGSGNHFLGMGRELALALPHVYRRLDDEVLHLAGHLMPDWALPRRTSWPDDWEEVARVEQSRSPERMLVAQVSHGVAVHDALSSVGVRPAAFIGYSLGESAALFASRAWRDRDAMFARTVLAPLFRTELCGPMTVLRRAWGPDADWKVVLVTRPAPEVRAALRGSAALLIVNAPRECVVGGTSRDIDEMIRRLGCEAVVLEGVPTVHLPLVEAVRATYHAHHVLPTTPPAGVCFYSAAFSGPYSPTESSAAESTTLSALRGFDFPALILRAWADGVRIFVEAGPQSSCTRMIGKILEGRPHLAVSACQRGQDGYRTFLLAIARLAEAGLSIDLEALYGEGAGSTSSPEVTTWLPKVVLGGARSLLPANPRSSRRSAGDGAPATPVGAPPRGRPDARGGSPRGSATAISSLGAFFASVDATARAHETFLRVAQEGLALQSLLLAESLRARGERTQTQRSAEVARFDRASCLEFATGRIAQVLGPDFADVDRFPTRVRLPDEPLMLVDRIISIEGVMGTPGPGRVVTEHDVLENAWYLDGDRAPVCISVEAGQADLFLSAYLGIDRETRGERVYRLLDAKIVFHRELPRPGERIRYDIRIDRFIRQGDTWLFFFRFEGSIGGQPLITMFDGCAGFFSTEQLTSGRGIVARATPATDASHAHGRAPEPFRPLLPPTSQSLSDEQVEALRRGDLGAAFGSPFEGKVLAPSLRLPGGRMRLVDRIVSLDPMGGERGLGEVTGEADVAPDAWYLTCHFQGDEVMPGTLMYECCLHTLRVLLLKLGWVPGGNASEDMHYGPVNDVVSELRCRGQVTRDTQRVRYRVTIEEMGYDPEPYAIARASMFADEKHVVQMDGMSLKMRGLSRAAVESLWRDSTAPAFDRAQIVAYAEGNPSECFGDQYRPFDEDRRLARLPRDPFLFLDRVVRVDAAPWVLAPGGWVTCEHDLREDAWYFDAGGQGAMPFVILLEAALQPCGWLAAYLGSALLSDTDLHFRNLDGSGTQLAEVHPADGRLTTRARLTKTSRAGDMILEEFEIEVLQQGRRVYVGQTGFGFFPASALSAQVGIRGAAAWANGVSASAHPRARTLSHAVEFRGLRLPGERLLMVDAVHTLDVKGGPAGLGLVVGTKRVNPEEWFMRAHFHQDPVMPGSLGLEALIALVKVFALERFPTLRETHRFQAMAVDCAHRWQYRGQVVPTNSEIRVEARITRLEEGPEPLVVADGQLAVDGKIIYSMTDFAVRLVRETSG